MWFKQTDAKSPQQVEPAAARPKSPAPPAAPAPDANAPAAPEPARFAPAPAAAAEISTPSSRITPGLSLKGEISGSEELWVGGSIEGTLRFSGARVTLGSSGTLRGDLEAREIVIEGRVDGNLRGAERVSIARTGEVKGDAAAPRVAIEEGAVFNGGIHVIREGEPRVAARTATNPSQTGAAHRSGRAGSAQAASAAAASGSASAPSSGIAAGGAAAASETSAGEASSETLVAPRSLVAGPSGADSH